MHKHYTYADLGLANADILATADKIFQPQAGGQTMFMSSTAELRLYGGAAGSGKTFAELLDPLRYIANPLFNAVICRQKMDDVLSPGGLWDESFNIYPYAGATAIKSNYSWIFEDGSTVSFCGLGTEKEVERWKGAQVCALYFDEITEIPKEQFLYMMTRNRSSSGIKPYACGTCNPDPSSWVFEFIKWYLTPEGFPDKTKRGVIRYYATQGDFFVFGDSIEYLCTKYDLKPVDVTSYTFIYATLEDNPKMLEKSPKYATALKNSGAVNEQRLLLGNWKVAKTGKLFAVNDFSSFYIVPSDLMYLILTIDTASKTKERNDWSVAQCWGKNPKGIFLLAQVRVKMELDPLYMLLKAFIIQQKSMYPGVTLRRAYIEDKQSGTQLIQKLQRDAIVEIVAVQRNRDKYSRALDCQGYVRGNYVYLNQSADYYADFIQEVVPFAADDKGHDDQVDCMMDAIEFLLIHPEQESQSDEECFGFTPRYS